MQSYTTVKVDWPHSEMLLPGRVEPVLRQAGPAFLARQRWFGAKSRTLQSVDLCDVIAIAANGLPLAIVLIDCRFAEGPSERYQLLLAVREAESDVPPPSVLACLHHPGGTAWLYDAATDSQACLAYMAMIVSPAAPTGASGWLAAEAAPALAGTVFDVGTIKAIGTEQSNSSIVFGASHILKLYRKLEAGLSPDLELNRFLSVEAGFAHVPRYYGALEYLSGSEATAVAIVQAFVPNRGDGWGDALQAVRGYLTESTVARLASYRDRVRGLGVVTGAMHRALASNAEEAALAPEPVTTADLAVWREAWRPHWQAVAPLLAARGVDADALLAATERAVMAMGQVARPGQKIRHHGDYHLGQVLVTDTGWIVLDFEGEPARSLAERRQKQTPLRDVAGMLRSFSYAAYAALFEQAQPGSAEWAALEPYAINWEGEVRHAFLDGYAEAVGESDLLPPDGPDRHHLLALFELDKAIYELGYELNNRPDWVRIPLAGIRRITGA